MAKGEYYKKAKSLLTENGYALVRNPPGSHEIWACGNPDDEDYREVSLPYNVKSRHTANAVLKAAGIKAKV